MKLLFPLITVLFIGLKLTDNIDWSWVRVLSPIWLPFAIFVVFVGIIAGLKAIK